jgi:hypothetical protein
VVVFMFVSIGVAAYFVGTSVLLVAENEKKTGACSTQSNVTGHEVLYDVTHSLGMPHIVQWSMLLPCAHRCG